MLKWLWFNLLKTEKHYLVWFLALCRHILTSWVCRNDRGFSRLISADVGRWWVVAKMCHELRRCRVKDTGRSGNWSKAFRWAEWSTPRWEEKPWRWIVMVMMRSWTAPWHDLEPTPWRTHFRRGSWNKPRRIEWSWRWIRRPWRTWYPAVRQFRTLEW